MALEHGDNYSIVLFAQSEYCVLAFGLHRQPVFFALHEEDWQREHINRKGYGKACLPARMFGLRIRCSLYVSVTQFLQDTAATIALHLERSIRKDQACFGFNRFPAGSHQVVDIVMEGAKGLGTTEQRLWHGCQTCRQGNGDDGSNQTLIGMH